MKEDMEKKGLFLTNKWASDKVIHYSIMFYPCQRYEDINSDKSTSAVFIVLTKAFNTIYHEILL